MSNIYFCHSSLSHTSPATVCATWVGYTRGGGGGLSASVCHLGGLHLGGYQPQCVPLGDYTRGGGGGFIRLKTFLRPIFVPFSMTNSKRNNKETASRTRSYLFI